MAIEVAREAGALLLELADGPLDTREKGTRGALVTASDRASEALIVERILAAYPNSAILGEEGGVRSGTSDERWIVDPLDGTTNYAHGYPMYCVSIAYERAGDVLAGAIYAPVFDEMFAAEKGAGATCNGAPIRISAPARLHDALVCTGFIPARYERNGENFARLSHLAQAVRRDGSAALDIAYVACGRFEAFWEFDLKAWDVAAGALIVREAGGTVTAIDGSPYVVDAGSLLASNGRVHGEMLEALRGP
ncbi:MAG: inositol monophosphatase [Candidatus Eremiobacteraeota bacterium]|nr:inositol monophosphatase [Candidatus Eremiobacteraeota bacterium]